MKLGRHAVVPFLVVAPACAPDFDIRNSRVDTERVLAVVAEPAEARPGDLVSYVALAAGPRGVIDAAAIEYSYCLSPKPLAENNTVADACAVEPGLSLESEPGGRAHGEIPSDACRIHGPDTPAGDFRPRDPDVTGGYYQPVRLAAFGQVFFHLQRVLCNPPDVAADVARDFAASYELNQNPIGASLAVGDDFDSEAVPVEAGAELALRLEWGPEAQEEYVVVDRAQQRVERRREGLTLDWFGTAGLFATDRQTIGGSDDSASAFTNRYEAPTTPGRATVWAVLHDDRRGTAVFQRLLEVR